MKLFRHRSRQRSDASRRLYARFEIAHTIVDFLAVLCFVIGSVLFFWQALETVAIWFFVVGSLFFMAKPTLRLVREIKLYRMGQIETLAERESD